MEISYEVEHRDVKYPRLEFKGLTLLVILPHEIDDATEILEKRVLGPREMEHNTRIS